MISIELNPITNIQQRLIHMKDAKTISDTDYKELMEMADLAQRYYIAVAAKVNGDIPSWRDVYSDPKKYPNLSEHFDKLRAKFGKGEKHGNCNCMEKPGSDQSCQSGHQES